MSFVTVLTAASGNTTASLLTTLLPFVVLIVVFYFLLIRPENKKKKALSEMRDSLSVGDEVTTIGGIVGKVVAHQGRYWWPSRPARIAFASSSPAGPFPPRAPRLSESK